jgi:hypothetical protein
MLPDMERAVSHQQYSVFIGKSLETPQFVQVGEQHTADMLLENLRIDAGFRAVFQNEIRSKAHTAFFSA